MAVSVELIKEDGAVVAYRVSRDFPNKASAAAAMKVLEMINPEAFSPLLAQQLEAAESGCELNCDTTPVSEV